MGAPLSPFLQGFFRKSDAQDELQRLMLQLGSAAEGHRISEKGIDLQHSLGQRQAATAEGNLALGQTTESRASKAQEFQQTLTAFGLQADEIGRPPAPGESGGFNIGGQVLIPVLKSIREAKEDDRKHLFNKKEFQQKHDQQMGFLQETMQTPFWGLLSDDEKKQAQLRARLGFDPVPAESAEQMYTRGTNLMFNRKSTSEDKALGRKQVDSALEWLSRYGQARAMPSAANRRFDFERQLNARLAGPFTDIAATIDGVASKSGGKVTNDQMDMIVNQSFRDPAFAAKFKLYGDPENGIPPVDIIAAVETVKAALRARSASPTKSGTNEFDFLNKALELGAERDKRLR